MRLCLVYCGISDGIFDGIFDRGIYEAHLDGLVYLNGEPIKKKSAGVSSMHTRTIMLFVCTVHAWVLLYYGVPCCR